MTTITDTLKRRYELDWLRVFAILVVFVYHSTRIFTVDDWHMKNNSLYWQVDVFGDILCIWMMPVIFVISGASLFYALGKGGFWGTVKDKGLRLLVPVVVGIFSHISLQVYIERINHGQFNGSYFSFMSHYFNGFYTEVGETGNFSFMGLHLWYLVVLFVLILAFYPLLRWLKGSGSKLLQKITNPLASPAGFFLLAFPLMLIDAFLSDAGLNELDPGGWGMLNYIWFFLAGFLIIANDRLRDSMLRRRWYHLGLGILLGAIYLYMEITKGTSAYQPIFENIDDLVRAICSFSLILATFGLGLWKLNYTSPALKYANEAVLPFYILHQTVLVVVGFFVVSRNLPDLIKYILIISISFPVILLTYEMLIRRSNLLRALFGMKSLPAKQSTKLVEVGA